MQRLRKGDFDWSNLRGAALVALSVALTTCGRPEGGPGHHGPERAQPLVAAHELRGHRRPLPSGMTHTAIGTAPRATPPTLRVSVTENGFEPPRVVVDPEHALVFRRTSLQTCATALVFPDLGIERALPLNVDVPIPLPATANGELAFQCGVGDNRGKVVARLLGS